MSASLNLNFAQLLKRHFANLFRMSFKTCATLASLIVLLFLLNIRSSLVTGDSANNVDQNSQVVQLWLRSPCGIIGTRYRTERCRRRGKRRFFKRKSNENGIQLLV